MSQFFNRVKQFNAMYGLPEPLAPVCSADTFARLRQFKKILADELAEVDDILLLEEHAAEPAMQLEILTHMADWLGDIVVYCTSEARRHGIPMELVLEVIMDSNASKLGADGQPIIQDGKVQKGPNYWKPEPKILKVIHAMRHAASFELRGEGK